MKVYYKKLHEFAKIPTMTHDGDGARDLFATEVVQEDRNSYIVKTGLSFQFSEKYRFRVVLRSSATKFNFVLINSPIIGDSNYTGEYYFRFKGIPIDYDKTFGLVYDDFPYKAGDRFAQCYFEKVLKVDFLEISKLNETTRGQGGFGSTGK